MNICKKRIFASSLLVFFSSFSLANEDAQVTAEELQYDIDKQENVVVVSIDPYDKWLDYLDKYDLAEGENERNGRTFFIASSSQEVPAHPDSSEFIDARQAAYKMAVSNAKAELAKSFGSWMVSESQLTQTIINEDAPQSYQEEVLAPISTVKRASILTDLALDNEIRKFDPTWDGTNKSKEEKVSKVVKQNQRYVEMMSARARAYLQGTGTIFSAEGDSDGYTIVVGIVWSFKSAAVAEAIYNPTVPLPEGRKNPLSIKDRLKNLSDEKLAATLGTRIWWDENGRPVVVSFAATDGNKLSALARSYTSLQARTQIAQFVSEIIESDAAANTDVTMQAYKDNSKAGFNNSSFEEKINSRSKLFKLPVSTIHYRKFNHPYSEKKMIVNVMAWTPDSAALARAMGIISADQETEFNATKGGAALVNSNSQTLSDVATPGLEGVSSDPDDF